MSMVIFEKNKPLVLEALEQGDFEYIEAANEVFEKDFFQHISAKNILKGLSETYPTPRKKHDVPLWLYIASNLSMRLHGEHAFHAYPTIVKIGGMLNAFGPEPGHRVAHPATGEVAISCEGHNHKNHYDRQTPCDQDYLRKMAKDTDAESLMSWFGDAVVREFHAHDAFDKEGIFIGDASYLFVPDNPRYEGSAVLRFDENDHPVSTLDYEQMSDKQKMNCQWRRCYKLVTLLHTRRELDYFLLVGVAIIPGNEHENPVLYTLVEEFVRVIGQGVMKRLILDRGFIDGKSISTCKKEFGSDVLIPIRRNMDIYEDARSLFQQPEVTWSLFEPHTAKPKKTPRPRPKTVSVREQKRKETRERQQQEKEPLPAKEVHVKTEVAAIENFTTWSSCSVPLTVVAIREHYADGHMKQWFLVDTRQQVDPCCARSDYYLRFSIEERYRQLKCFCEFTQFTSRAFSLVVNQVIFMMLAYNLLQLFLLHKGRQDLNSKTLPQVRQHLQPSNNYIIVYWKNYYGAFDAYEYTEIIAMLNEEARIKIARRSRFLKHQSKKRLNNPRFL